jgi:malate/lactate dehydrogenase
MKHPIFMSVPVLLSTEGLKISDPVALKKGELSALKRSAQTLLEYQGFLED